MTRKKNSKVEDITERRIKLQEIIEKYKLLEKPATKIRLLEEMEKAGYKMDRMTLYRDIVAISRNNTFVRDIAESTYSSLIHQCFDRLDDIEEKALVWLKNPPKTSKQKSEFDTTTNKMVLKEIISETVSPIVIMNLLLDVVQARLKALEGDIVDTSVALMSEEFQKIKDENEKLQLVNSRLGEEKNTSDDNQHERTAPDSGDQNFFR